MTIVYLYPLSWTKLYKLDYIKDWEINNTILLFYALTSGNVDFSIESFRDDITNNNRSSTGMSHINDETTGIVVVSLQCSLETILLSKGICLFSKLNCSLGVFGKTRAGILSKILGRFSCWALTVSSNEYEGGSFHPGV